MKQPGEEGVSRPRRGGRIWLLLPLALATFSLRQESQIVRKVEKGVSVSYPNKVLSQHGEMVLNDDSKKVELPQIVWLASYPNSGTSYTMTTIERASNLSTATNYGNEVTPRGGTSIPLHPTHPEGPYWEGLSGKLGRIRQLPETYVLTKTHCGGRCMHCGADQYVVSSVKDFVKACARTSWMRKGRRTETHMDPNRVARVVHLIRNPFHNVVARFHLERRHYVRRDTRVDPKLPDNATGFAKWCDVLDDEYERKERAHLPSKLLPFMRKVPCRGEFYRYAQWHQRLVEMIDSMHIPVLTVYYEDYHFRPDATVNRIMDFLNQTVRARLEPFRFLPSYQEYFTDTQRQSAANLIHAMTTPDVWKLIERYLGNHTSAESS